MSSPPPPPPWVDPEARDEPPSSSTAIETVGGNDSEAITVCARFWQYASTAMNIVFLALLTIGCFIIIFTGDAPKQQGFPKLKSEAALLIVYLIFFVIASLSIRGAFRFKQGMMVPSFSIYSLLFLISLFTRKLGAALMYVAFAIPQGMMFREIRRGVKASSESSTNSYQG